MNKKNTVYFILLASCVMLFGVGCPKPPEPELHEPIPEEQTTTASTAPDDGLDAALEDLDAVDTESSGAWDAY
jgi:energy-converting hydrogenase Eha subunit F